MCDPERWLEVLRVYRDITAPHDPVWRLPERQTVLPCKLVQTGLRLRESAGLTPEETEQQQGEPRGRDAGRTQIHPTLEEWRRTQWCLLAVCGAENTHRWHTTRTDVPWSAVPTYKKQCISQRWQPVCVCVWATYRLSEKIIHSAELQKQARYWGLVWR